MIKEISSSLLSAVAAINQKSREAYVAEQKALQEKMAAKQVKMPATPTPKADPAAVKDAKKMAEEVVDEGAEGTTPKTPKEKKLAALAEPKGKITHADVMTGRGVRKEEKEESAAHEKAEKKGNNPFDWKNYKSRIAKKPGEMTGHDSKKISTGTVFTKKAVKEENMDTPGNSTHQCAIHVKSEQFGEGRTLTSQHAEPDAEGNIAWYDVMFAEGIKRVETKDLEIVVSESHMNHKKKKAK